MGFFKKRRNLKEQNKILIEEVKKLKTGYVYNDNKLEDDFLVLLNILNAKISYYKKITFSYNRFLETKIVNVTTEEVREITEKIVSDTFKSLSDVYLNYLVDKYFRSLEDMLNTYTEKVFLDLFEFANTFNINRGNLAQK